MCGRFTRMYTWQELVALYHLSVPAMTNFQPRYNIRPTDTSDVVIKGSDDRGLAAMRWGHIPAFEAFLPEPRKWWNSEDPRMGLFDAAALALTFFHSSKSGEQAA